MLFGLNGNEGRLGIFLNLNPKKSKRRRCPSSAALEGGPGRPVHVEFCMMVGESIWAALELFYFFFFLILGWLIDCLIGFSRVACGM
jgi:hypothetical protein